MGPAAGRSMSLFVGSRLGSERTREKTLSHPLRSGARLALGVAIASLSILGSLLSATAAPAATLSAKLVPSNGALLGVVANPRDGGEHEAEVQFLESEIGRRFDLVRNFHAWDSDIVSAGEEETRALGRIPIVNWTALKRDGSVTSWASIAGGAEDARIVHQADELK